MRALVQRVSSASVTVEGKIISQIEQGLLVLICAMQGDSPDNAEQIAAKIAKLRVFRDDSGRMNRSLLDVRGSALVVSQFTLAADTRKGNRPGFSAAASPELGVNLYAHFSSSLAGQGLNVQTGRFGADMAVSLVNDGPVTIWLEI